MPSTTGGSLFMILGRFLSKGVLASLGNADY